MTFSLRPLRWLVLLSFAGSAMATAADTASQRPRARAAGIKIGVLSPGPLNAITDVDQVLAHYRRARLF